MTPRHPTSPALPRAGRSFVTRLLATLPAAALAAAGLAAGLAVGLVLRPDAAGAQSPATPAAARPPAAAGTTTFDGGRADPYALVPGAVLRVAAPTLFAPARRGRLLAVAGDSLVIATEKPAEVRTIAREQIAGLEVRSATRTRKVGALRGALVGGLVGALAGIVYYQAARSPERPPPGPGDISLGLDFGNAFVALGASLMVPAGVGVGGLVGSRLPGHSWRAVSVARAVALTPSPRGLGVAVRF